MKNRIDLLFKQKTTGITSIYFTAGFPELNNTLIIAKELQANGIDMLEIGIPFSDPLADGPVIQQSSEDAIRNGMSIEVLFQQLSELRQHIHIPVLLMGYYNPILQYGVKQFLQKAASIGIDGLIIPDLPLDEYQEHYQFLFERLNLKNVLLITPQTQEKRIKLIDEVSGGFIYVVSSSSTTGGTQNNSAHLKEYLQKLKSMHLKNPCMVGFGISTKADIRLIQSYASGVIIGSAFIKAVSKNNLHQSIISFIQSIKT